MFLKWRKSERTGLVPGEKKGRKDEGTEIKETSSVLLTLLRTISVSKNSECRTIRTVVVSNENRDDFR